MKASLYDRLWRRESGEQSRYASLSGIYGSKEWVNDLDIVNELGGHMGCINALWWVSSILHTKALKNGVLTDVAGLALADCWHQVRTISMSTFIPINRIRRPRLSPSIRLS